MEYQARQVPPSTPPTLGWELVAWEGEGEGEIYSSILNEMISCAIRDTFTVKHTPIELNVSRMVQVVSRMVQGVQGFPGSSGDSNEPWKPRAPWTHDSLDP